MHELRIYLLIIQEALRQIPKEYVVDGLALIGLGVIVWRLLKVIIVAAVVFGAAMVYVNYGGVK